MVEDEDLEKNFRNPSSNSRTVPFWSWNHTIVKDEKNRTPNYRFVPFGVARPPSIVQVFETGKRRSSSSRRLR